MAQTVEHIAEILNDMRIESKSNIQDIEAALGKIFAKIETAGDNNENYELIKVYISELKKIVEEKLASNISEITEGSSQQIRESFDRNTLQLHTVFNGVNEVKDAVESLKRYFSEIDDVVKSSNLENIQLLSTKLEELESLLAENYGNYGDKLKSVQDSIYEFAKTVEENAQDNRSKLETSVSQLTDIKNGLQNIYNNLKTSDESNNEIASSIISSLNEKISTITDGLDSINENLKSGVAISLQEELNNIQQNFDKIIDSLSEIKESADNSQIAQNLDDNISLLKGELTRVTDNMLSILDSNREENITALENFKNNISEFLSNNAEKVTAELKSQLDNLFTNFSVDINTELTDGMKSLSNMEQFYKEASDKLGVIEDYVADKIRTDIELLNNVFKSGVKEVRSSFKEELDEKYEALTSSVDMVLNDKTVQKSIDIMKNEIFQRVDTIISNSESAALKHDEIVNSINAFAKNMKLFVVRVSQLIIAKYSPEKNREMIESLQENDEKIAETLSEIISKVDNANIPVIEDIGRINTKLDTIDTTVSEKLNELNSKVDTIVSDNSNLTIIEDIGNINTKLDNIVSGNLTEISAKIDDFRSLSGSIELLNSKVDTIASDNSNSEVITEIGNINYKLNEILAEKVALLNEKLELIKSENSDPEILENISELKSQTDKIVNDERTDIIIENVNDLSSKLMDFLGFSQDISELSEKVDEIRARDNSVEIIENINDLSSKISDFMSVSNDINELSVKTDNVGNVNAQIFDNINRLEAMFSSFVSINQDITELNSKFDTFASNNKAEIIENINNVSQNIDNLSTKVDLLVSDNSSNEIIENINNVSQDLNDLNIKVNTLMSDNSSNEIIENIGSVSQNIDDLSTKVDVLVSDNSSNEIIENINNVSQNIDNLSAKVDVLISDNSSNEIKENINNVSQDINNLNTKVDVLVSDNSSNEIIESINNVNSKLSDFMTIAQTVDVLNAKIDTITSDVPNCEIADNINELSSKLSGMIDISQEFTHIASKVDELADDESSAAIIESLSNLNSKISDFMLITNNFDELSAKIDNFIANKSDAEIIEDLKNISDKLNSFDFIYENLNNLSSKLDTAISQNSNFEIVEDIANVNRKLDDILENTLHVLNEKIDAIASNSFEQNILQEVDDIKNTIFEQRRFIEDLNDERASVVDKYLQEVLDKFDTLNFQNTAQDIKDTILNALLSLVDQISFVEETEEIKDFVEEKTEAINKNIIELKNKIKQIVNPDDDGFSYVYTLQDVESDIAKLRLAINNIKNRDFTDIIDEIRRMLNAVNNLEQSLTHEEIEKIKSDLVSISTRTNKLLLNSEASNKTINDSLNNFSDMVSQNTSVVQSLDMRLDNISNFAQTSAQNDKVFHQSLLYLGEWIDSTTEKLADISQKSYLVPEIQTSINSIETSLPETIKNLEVLKNRFDEQTDRIDKLENKLEQILSKIEENDNSKLNKKLDKIEKLVSGLSAGIEKITSYVDE